MNGTNKLVSTKIVFPYQFKIINNEQIADPVIYLDVLTQFGLRRIGFLVDSGSDAIILPLSPYHFWFNFKPDTKTATTLGGVEGRLDIWDKFNWLFDNQRKQVIFERLNT